MRFADLDAVTIDAHGTLVELIDPVPPLREALRERGIERSTQQVGAGFGAEVEYYLEHLGDRLDDLQVASTGVFLAALDADLPAGDFRPAFVGAIRFRVLDGVERSLALLKAHGLELAVVANWDKGLAELLEELGLGRFFSSVEPVAAKPSPDALLRALAALRVAPDRSLHVGDRKSDEDAAAAAGTHYLRAPLAEAVACIR